MTFFSKPAVETDVKYNKLFKRERVTIDRCFKQLKRRLFILQYVYRVKKKLPVLCSTMLQTLCAMLILNFRKMYRGKRKITIPTVKMMKNSFALILITD